MASFFLGLAVGIVVRPWLLPAARMSGAVLLGSVLEMIRMVGQARVLIACRRHGHAVQTACEYEGGTKETCGRCLKYRIVKDGTIMVPWH